MPTPPRNETELLQRARSIAGQSLSQLATHLGWRVPADFRRQKGWAGQLIESALGASAASRPEPDFQAIGVELKTLPIGAKGVPCESTYVCTVPLDSTAEHTWERSWLRRKLSRVLWVPLEADSTIAVGDRRIGMPLLWSPDAGEEATLRRDWEELMERVCLGEIEAITARDGEVLQIRPKAAHARVARPAAGADGEQVMVNPRGFYLRSRFTASLLRRHYAHAGP